VVEMTASAPGAYLTCQFDEFLYARIDEGSDTTPLSVLSMLARLDLDPWEEAAKLICHAQPRLRDLWILLLQHLALHTTPKRL
jgi:hypothetical protein